MCRAILQLSGIRERQFAAGIGIAAQYIRQSIAGDSTQIPSLHHRGHFVQPRHRHGISADQYHHHILIHFEQRTDELVLSERQVIRKTVARFAILLVVLVQSAHVDNQVSFFRFSHGILTQRVHHRLRYFIHIAIHRTPCLISLRIHHITVLLLQAFQRRNEIFHFQFRRASSLHQIACSVIAHHKDVLVRIGSYREQARLLLPVSVLQKHGAFHRYIVCRAVMFGRSQRAERLVAVHRRTEYQAKHPSRLVIDHFHGNLAFLYHLQISLAQVIIIISELRFRSQSVGVRTHFEIKTVHGGFVRIVCRTPIGHHTPVELPFAFQDVVIQEFAMRRVRAAYLIISTHDAPRATPLYRRTECGQIDFVQGTVAQLYIDMPAPQFLVIQGIMLHASRHTVLLQLLDIRHAHLPCQVRVFAHVLEIAPIKRRTVNVYARTQLDIFPAIQGFFAQCFSVSAR